MNPVKDSKQIILVRFHHMLRAHLLVGQLEQHGIQAFLTNEMLTDLIPTSAGGYIIRVFDSDAARANEILQEFYRQETAEEDFHEADHEDIAYEKLKHDRAQKKKVSNLYLIPLIILMILIYLLSNGVI